MTDSLLAVTAPAPPPPMPTEPLQKGRTEFLRTTASCAPCITSRGRRACAVRALSRAPATSSLPYQGLFTKGSGLAKGKGCNVGAFPVTRLTEQRQNANCSRNARRTPARPRQCGVPGASRRGELHESHVAWSGHSRKRSDHRARRLSLLPAGVGAHGISAVGPQDGGRSPLSPQCAVFQSLGRNPQQRVRRLGVRGAAGFLRPRGSLDRVLERRRAATLTEQRRAVAYVTSAARAESEARAAYGGRSLTEL